MKMFYVIRTEGARPAIADVSPVDDGVYEINRINVPEPYRGRGLASQLLADICCDADEQQVTLCLSPVPSGGLEYADLVRWYGRYGFKMMDEGMQRSPIL